MRQEILLAPLLTITLTQSSSTRAYEEPEEKGKPGAPPALKFLDDMHLNSSETIRLSVNGLHPRCVHAWNAWYVSTTPGRNRA